jgi:hypothetical protein
VEADELVFFGKIAAGVTHEIRNVLATISESNGLMGDLLEMLKDTPFAHREKFQRSVARIEEQVRRGADITACFNGFAHSVDKPGVHVDLNEIAARTVSLAARFARLRNVELKAASCGQPVMLFTNAFRLQMALTRAVEAFLGCMGGKGSIMLSAKGAPGPPCVNLDCEAGTGERVARQAVAASGEWREFEQLASLLDIRCEWQAQGGGLALFFGGGPVLGQAANPK